MINDECMHRVLWAFDARFNGGEGRTLSDDLSTLGRELFAMNSRALGARYGDQVETAADFAGYSYRPQLNANKCAVLKAIRCLLYQCTEGKVPEETLFKMLEERAARLCYQIVQDLPAYDAAPWG